MMPPIIVVPFTDTHINCKTALCPPQFVDEEGLGITISRAHRWLYNRWADYWKRAAEIKKETKGTIVALALGDIADEITRKKAPQLITTNRTNIIKMATKAMEPMLEVADALMMVRGTAFHVGETGDLTEALARDLGALPDEHDHYSRWFVYQKFNDVLIYAAHRPETRGTMIHTEDAGIGRNEFLLRASFNEAGLPVPDLALFGHVHNATDSGQFKKPHVMYLPSWELRFQGQATNGYVANIGKLHRIAPVGGVFIVCQDGQSSVEPFLREPPRRPPCNFEIPMKKQSIKTNLSARLSQSLSKRRGQKEDT